MKAYFQLAQAQIALREKNEALESAKKAHVLCVGEIERGGKGGSSLGMIGELVLRCKKEVWESREEERLRVRLLLLGELVIGLEKGMVEEAERCLGNGGTKEDVERVEKVWLGKIDELRRVWDLGTAGDAGGEKKRRPNPPDWCVDDITFGVMVDPVVVCFTDSSPFLQFLAYPLKSPLLTPLHHPKKLIKAITQLTPKTDQNGPIV